MGAVEVEEHQRRERVEGKLAWDSAGVSLDLKQWASRPSPPREHSTGGVWSPIINQDHLLAKQDPHHTLSQRLSSPTPLPGPPVYRVNNQQRANAVFYSTEQLINVRRRWYHGRQQHTSTHQFPFCTHTLCARKCLNCWTKLRPGVYIWSEAFVTVTRISCAKALH